MSEKWSIGWSRAPEGKLTIGNTTNMYLVDEDENKLATLFQVGHSEFMWINTEDRNRYCDEVFATWEGLLAWGDPCGHATHVMYIPGIE